MALRPCSLATSLEREEAADSLGKEAATVTFFFFKLKTKEALKKNDFIFLSVKLSIYVILKGIKVWLLYSFHGVCTTGRGERDRKGPCFLICIVTFDMFP